jgi:hypothetical protein
VIPDPTPDAGTTTTITTNTSTNTSTTTSTTTALAQNTAGAGCVRVVAGRKRVKLRGVGKLRLKLTRNSCLTAPIAARAKPRKGMKLRSVRYKLDGKRLKRVKRVKFAAKLRPARLSAGRHTLKLRVKPVTGRAKTFKVRLRLAVA